MDTKEFFKTYIFDWMCADIEREISWAKSGGRAGNALTALGLLAYTEFMGSQLPLSRRPSDGARARFNAFFRELGPNYAFLLDKRKINVYDIFRCGLAHEYCVKETCKIAMLNSTPGELEIKGPLGKPVSITKPVDCGIGVAANGGYWFVVEKYYEDFRKACDSLLNELLALKSPQPPPIKSRIMSDSG